MHVCNLNACMHVGTCKQVSVHICVHVFFFGVCLSACMHGGVCTRMCACIVGVKKIYILYKYTNCFKTFSLGNVVK